MENTPYSEYKNKVYSYIHHKVLLKYIDMTPDDQNLLKQLKPVLMPYLPSIIDAFYEQLLAMPLSKPYFQQPSMVERLKKAQINYFDTLLEGNINEDYIITRKKIGQTHERVGLEPRWYLGGYALFCQIIFPYIREHFKGNAEDIEKAQLALLKAFFLDMQITMETYIDRYAGELVDARNVLEQKLWMEDRLLSFILTEASDAIVGLDEQDRISTWSQGAQRIFGYKTSEIIDTKLEDLLERPTVLQYARKSLQTHGSATLYGSDWITKHGNTIVADATLTRIDDEDANLVGYTLIIRDTTEVRRLANKVKTMEQLAAMTKVTASVAHEIRTPLGIMALTGDLLLDRINEVCEYAPENERTSIQAELKEMVGDLQTQVDRLNEIVDHYLVLSRIRKPNRNKINIAAYMQDIEDELMKRFPNKNIRFELSIDDDDVYVSLDPDHFRRVFLNLCENASYAIQNNTNASIMIRAFNNKDNVTMQVEDNGIGIPDNELEKIFSAFHTNKPTGTGLGLYLVKEIVESHEGCVDIKSQKGVGTTVIIILPRTLEEEIINASST